MRFSATNLYHAFFRHLIYARSDLADVILRQDFPKSNKDSLCYPQLKQETNILSTPVQYQETQNLTMRYPALYKELQTYKHS